MSEQKTLEQLREEISLLTQKLNETLAMERRGEAAEVDAGALNDRLAVLKMQLAEEESKDHV